MKFIYRDMSLWESALEGYLLTQVVVSVIYT